VEAGAQLEQGGDASADHDASLLGFGESGDEAEEGAFAGAVASDDCEAVAVVEVEGYVAEGVEASGLAAVEELLEEAAEELGSAAVAEGLGDVGELDQSALTEEFSGGLNLLGDSANGIRRRNGR